MVQLSKTPPHFISLEAALRNLTVDDRAPGRLETTDETHSTPGPVVPTFGPAVLGRAGDPAAEAVVLWGRCGYVARSCVEAARNTGFTHQLEPKSGN